MTKEPRVLVIDDDQDCADSTAILLRRLGASARPAYSGAQALEMLADFKPHLALIDIGMPDMDGFETARRIRLHPQGRSLTLVALTGWGRQQDRRRSLEAGFDHHFVKPIDADALETLLSAARAIARPGSLRSRGG